MLQNLATVEQLQLNTNKYHPKWWMESPNLDNYFRIDPRLVLLVEENTVIFIYELSMLRYIVGQRDVIASRRVVGSTSRWSNYVSPSFCSHSMSLSNVQTWINYHV